MSNITLFSLREEFLKRCVGGKIEVSKDEYEEYRYLLRPECRKEPLMLNENILIIKKTGLEKIWDEIKIDLDDDIVKAFEEKTNDINNYTDFYPAYYFIGDPILSAINLQLVREIKKFKK
jgi:hypothetical protein